MPDNTKLTVLITGANSGIGLATTLTVAKRGFRTVGSVRSAAKAKEVKAAADRAGVKVETVILDVTDAERAAAVIAELRPWGLVNNAGYGMTGAIEDVDDDEARRILETMVLAPMRLCRLALPHLREQKGRVVNMSSILGLVTGPLMGWYAGAKHALEALTDALRVELASDGVRVVLVEPGGISTNIWEDLAADVEHRRGSRFEAAYQRALTGTKATAPLMGKPDQVATVVVRALTSRVVQDRYLVGLDAQALAWMIRFTPNPLRDAAARMGLGL
jgi:NAD(P)-dependent dehydrogenase (short-subunit alcohol dehydrogenase family)